MHPNAKIFPFLLCRIKYKKMLKVCLRNVKTCIALIIIKDLQENIFSTLCSYAEII